MAQYSAMRISTLCSTARPNIDPVFVTRNTRLRRSSLRITAVRPAILFLADLEDLEDGQKVSGWIATCPACDSRFIAGRIPSIVPINAVRRLAAIRAVLSSASFSCYFATRMQEVSTRLYSPKRPAVPPLAAAPAAILPRSRASNLTASLHNLSLSTAT